MPQVKSTTVQRHFGEMLREAQREPVEILSHGRTAAYLVSPHEYRRLKTRDRRVVFASELTDEDVARIRAAEPPVESAQFDHEVK